MTLSTKNIADKIGLKGSFVEVNFPKLHTFPNIAEAAFELGIINKLRDSTASMTDAWFAALKPDERVGTKADMKLAKVNKLIESLMTGEWSMRAESSGPRVTDPIDKEAKKLAAAIIDKLVTGWNAKVRNEASRANLVAMGLALNKPFDGTDESGFSVIGEAIAQRMTQPDVQERARRNVQETSETAAAVSIADMFKSKS